MGAIYLLTMPQVLRDAGLEVDTFPGWETRARSTGGYDAVLAVQVHQTASNTTPLNDMNYMWKNATDKPIGAIHLARDGKWTVGAAGATNTSGKGGPLQTSKGVIPLDAANRYVISIEAANAGNGEPWPLVQQLSYVKGVAALCKAYGIQIAYPDVHAHFEWTTRKVDPAGESLYASGANKWNMAAFREDVVKASFPPVVPPPVVTPPPTITGVPDVFFPLPTPLRNSDTRAFGGPGVPAGQHRIGLHPAVIPPNAVAVAINMAVIPSGNEGFLTVWPGGARPNTSIINYEASGAHNGAAIVGVQDNHIQVYLTSVAHFVVDITGYWTA